MQIGLICAERQYCDGDRQRIQSIFGDTLTINEYAVNDGSIFSLDDNDEFYVIVMVAEYCEAILSILQPGKPIIYGKLAFSQEQLSVLAAYPPGTKGLLVSKEASLAFEALASVYREGLKNLELFPYYPGASVPEGISLAITTGYPELIPSSIPEHLDIGTRTLDVPTIDSIIALTGLHYLTKTAKYLKFVSTMSGYANRNFSCTQSFVQLNHIYSAVVSMINIGIIVADEADMITAANDFALNYLGKYNIDVIGQKLSHFVLQGHIKEAKLRKLPVTFSKKKAVQKLEFTLVPMYEDNTYIGTTIMITTKDTGTSLQQHIISRLVQSGHKAKYTFEDIIGRSAELLKAIDIAKRLSKADASVLIIGESGTGKELFAQSIHNNSARKAAPFVAINCAAIPDTLFESELFGYEEGAFSGAKHGGKAGFLEIANHGTLFFDEIDSLSLPMQTKILRVIQEKNFMRVGGNSLIEVDVRIISATNQNLYQCVENGNFRRDLYYRINTLPLELPPLRERSGDILYLVQHFCTVLNCTFTLTASAREVLQSYSWPGNIRELRNCIEYLGCLEECWIEPSFLPEYMLHAVRQEDNPSHGGDAIYPVVAGILENMPCGRNRLIHALSAKGVTLSEAKARDILREMQRRGWIGTRGGRGGSYLTQAGRDALLRRL